jgi:hypothetical protein
MNTKALEALTAKQPDEYSCYARRIAAMCQERCPKYLRPRPDTAWNMLAWYLIQNADFRIFMAKRGIAGLARFVATVIDIWGYWINAGK